MTTHHTIPSPAELREQIAARVAEVRALRRMLQLAEAAATAATARSRQRPLPVSQEVSDGR